MYGGIYPDHSPLIVVRCDHRAIADSVCAKLASIPNLIVLKRFGARRRQFGPDSRCDLVRLDMIVRNAESGEEHSRIPVVIPYNALMAVARLDPEDDLIGVLEFSAEQLDALRQHVQGLSVEPSTFAYGADLDTVELDSARG